MPSGKITTLFSRVDRGLSHHPALDLDVNHAERHKLIIRDGTSHITLQLYTLCRHSPTGVTTLPPHQLRAASSFASPQAHIGDGGSLLLDIMSQRLIPWTAIGSSSELQCLHLMACTLIISAQYGHSRSPLTATTECPAVPAAVVCTSSQPRRR